ncbi:carbohydrate-binding module family 20 domain-containing protein [Paenibacillus thiaminolyticus]|uniref:carbohydrate-binding module family 20 domain-containing protein n=1 Tax=Paenibacillus thiaminolyticus TaxID=49283 RepID=UPI001981DAA1|nr:carbohydrate-binding module family 20 domain-containing protein [Paenibacillus thiaminolyticus]
MYSNDDALVYKRQFFDTQVIVAVNRQPDRSVSVPALTTTLPAGTYADALDGLLYGRAMTVVNQIGLLQIPAYTLAGGEVSVWSHDPPADPAEPHIGDVISTMGQLGNTIYIYGTGLGGSAAVAFGSQQATVVSAQDNRIAAVVPNVPAGATFQFKFIIKDAAGHVTWEGGANRSFTATSITTGTSDTPVYNWQP